MDTNLMEELTDEMIALAVKRGDKQAFGTLIDRFEPKLRRYARRFLFDNDDIDDKVQDVFIKAYTNIQSFDETRPFGPWIYRIAHNEFVNALKKKLGSTIFPFDLDTILPVPVARETADENSRTEELKAMIDAHLKDLDPKYREPLILYYFEELDYGEIADVLQIPVSTVGVRLRRGKEALRKRIETKNDEFVNN